jgi:hypothetical protein
MSVATENAVVRLGDREFPVAGFTFDQLQLMLPHLADMANPWTSEGIDAQRAYIRGALHGRIDPAELDSLEITLVQLDDAVGVISRISGLAEMGERMARAKQALSTGTGSTQTS